MQQYPKILILAALVLGMSACDQYHAMTTSPGKYEKTTSSTDAAGTTTKRTTSKEVEIDNYGNKSTVETTKTTSDPQGLFNKKTTSKTTNSTEIIK